jgi:RimJ/RimL family protein N-acetyltransferase
LVGAISLDHDAASDTVELGYWLSESVWANGYGREAAGAIVDYAFTTLELNALISSFHNDNPFSGRILKRLGFMETGQSMNFSRAQNSEVAMTNVRLTRAHWDAKKGRDI